MSNFGRAEGGTIVLKFALVVPLLFMIVGGAIDYTRFLQQQGLMQRAADAAALAAASEISLSDSGKNNLEAVARAVTEKWVVANAHGAFKMPVVKAEYRDDPMEVDVTLVANFQTTFGSFGINPEVVAARAIARVVGRPNICLLALDPSERSTLWLVKEAQLTGNNCSIFSNSSASDGVRVQNKARIGAQNVCSAGGAKVDGLGRVTPPPFLDCPQFEDPLAARPEPSVGPCDHPSMMVIEDKTITLSPGVYCGGIVIKGNSRVMLEPGDYFVKAGMLEVADDATMSGKDVSFFFSELASFTFAPRATIVLEASTHGPMAGILFFASRNQSPLIQHTILSRNAQTLVGLIYLPRNLLVIDGDAQVAGASAWTAIIARQVKLLEGPHVVLNSDYDATDVPVPEGIRGVAPIALAQ